MTLNATTHRSADCQWSRHILCLNPAECTCPCHQHAAAPVCDAVASSGNDCDVPASYVFVARGTGMMRTITLTLLPHVGELNHPEREACDHMAAGEECDQLATFAWTEWQDEETREGIYNLCSMHAAEWVAEHGARAEGL